ncbi:hypothetical protein N665_0468s0028 [Sinapis alba]|nr:hypothetical protein N665_0468s0028 [Sinapis alba]
MEGGSQPSGSASTLSNDENLVVSCEDSSSPAENELELGLTLGYRERRISYAVDSSSSSSLSSRASVTAGIKRTADSMAATSGQVVGWPPIRTYRMNSMVNQAKTLAMEDPNMEVPHATKLRNSMFVKVTMDGLPIGRKIDLNAHKCYESLSNTLEDMFLKPKTDGHMEAGVKILPDGSSGLVLTYEDKEGDWMLVGDVPWGMFVGSVKRLRIMKTSEATGTAKMIL